MRPSPLEMVIPSTSPAWRIILRAEVAELVRLTEWIEHFAQQAKLPPDQAFAIQLCVEEAVVNVIMHSGVAENGQPITLELAASGYDVTAVIEDKGRPFDPTTVPPHSKPASLKDAEIGKLGVHLMRDFASEIRYERRNGHNRLTLKFNAAEPVSKE